MTRNGLAGLQCLIFALVMSVCAARVAEAQQTVPELPDSAASLPAADPAADPGTDPARADDLPLWQRTLYKTLTYQAAANAADVLVFDLLVGASAATTTGFFAANAVTAAAAYYGFEYAWQTFGPTLDETTEETIVEKTILYRFIGIGRNFTLGYAYGGDPLTAGIFTGLNIAYDTSIFLTNEYVWDIMRPQQAP